jgi:hypothetical protein
MERFIPVDGLRQYNGNGMKRGSYFPLYKNTNNVVKPLQAQFARIAQDVAKSPWPWHARTTQKLTNRCWRDVPERQLSHNLLLFASDAKLTSIADRLDAMNL